MKLDLLKGLRCPATWRPLALRDERVVDGVVMEGTLVAKGGRYVYPIRDGAAFLAVLDEAWETILKELINRREIIEENLKNPPELATSSSTKKAEQDAIVSTLAELCFDEAFARMPKNRPLRLIDCGAGMFETSAYFAQHNIDVVATDTEISMVRYANFQGRHHGDPQPFQINGQPYYIRDPKGHPDYFSRVVCDIQRLPFTDGFFDVAFCRAMLHHVDRPAVAIREMARLVRPGGMIVICAEPFRSILDREEDYHEGTVDREEGMNERAPSMLEYRGALGRIGRQIRVQYWPADPMETSLKIFRRIGWNYRRHLWPGEELKNWKWMKLLPWSGGVNFYATRNRTSVGKPAPIRDKEVETISKVVDVYTAYDNVKTIEGLRKGTEELKAMRRELMAPISNEFPYSVKPGMTYGWVLEAGWNSVERDAEGRLFRFVLKRAALSLQAGQWLTKLQIVHGGGRPDFVYTTEVRLNGIKVGELRGIGDRRRKSVFDFPPGIERSDYEVMMVEFSSTVMNEHKESRSHVGAGIYFVEFL